MNDLKTRMVTNVSAQDAVLFRNSIKLYQKNKDCFEHSINELKSSQQPIFQIVAKDSEDYKMTKEDHKIFKGL